MSDNTTDSDDLSTRRARGDVAEPFELESPNHPIDCARALLDAFHFEPEENMFTLIYWNKIFFEWRRKQWVEIDREDLEANVSWILSNAFYMREQDNGPPEQTRFQVNNKNLDNIMRALRNLIARDRPVFNTWLHARDGDPLPENVIILNNGILNIETKELFPHTPRFFNAHCAEFNYNPWASCPVTEAWLYEAMEGDQERIALAIEWMGYIITNDISMQKMLSAIGPPGSGKGTYTRLCQWLVGEANVGTPDMISLGSDFGLQNNANKQLITIGDIQTLGRNAAESLSRLVAITGADKIEVNVKNRTPFTTTFPGRIMTASNRVPALPDRDGALQRRMLVLRYRKSFVEKQDNELGDRLKAELPGVFNWALAGLASLRARGHFVQPEIGKEMMRDLAAGAAPQLEFAKECCIIAEGVRISRTELFDAWKMWARQYNFREGAITSLTRAITGEWAEIDPEGWTLSSEGPRRRAYIGIALSDEAKQMLYPNWMPL